MAIEASENAERAGDRSASLEYYARVLAMEPDGIQLKSSDADPHSDLKGNTK